MYPNILIVDDDNLTLQTARMYLQEFARVHIVDSGRRAIEFVKQNHVDLILLDVEMPIMDGYVTLERLRKLEECINVPVVLLTGRKDKSTVFQFGAMGIDGYLAKPVPKETLISKVKEILETYTNYEHKKTIMMIDDDVAYLKQLETMLHEKYNVIMINSAKMALNYLSKYVPDLILLDYEMPLYNGANVMNMLQRSGRERHIPVIIISGSLDKKALENCFLHSPAGYLAKPVAKDVLIQAIENTLNTKEE